VSFVWFAVRNCQERRGSGFASLPCEFGFPDHVNNSRRRENSKNCRNRKQFGFRK